MTKILKPVNQPIETPHFIKAIIEQCQLRPGQLKVTRGPAIYEVFNTVVSGRNLQFDNGKQWDTLKLEDELWFDELD